MTAGTRDTIDHQHLMVLMSTQIKQAQILMGILSCLINHERSISKYIYDYYSFLLFITSTNFDNQPTFILILLKFRKLSHTSLAFQFL